MKTSAIVIVAGLLSVFAFGATAAESQARKMSPMPGAQLANEHINQKDQACIAECVAVRTDCYAAARAKLGQDGAHGQQWLSDTYAACDQAEQACYSRCYQQNGRLDQGGRKHARAAAAE